MAAPDSFTFERGVGSFDGFVIDTVKEFSFHAFSCLGCKGWGRVDLIKDRENNFQLIEINTVPGLTEKSLVPKSAAIEGIDFNNLIVRILNTSCLNQ